MSEITKEKRERLRKHASEWVEMGDYCHIKPETMLGLLDALERAEARADGGLIEELKRANALIEKKEARVKLLEKEMDGADAEIASLRDQLEDCQAFDSSAPQVLCDIARLLGVYEHCQESGDDMGQMVLDEAQSLIRDKQKAKAVVVRLTKERNWLADVCSVHCLDKCPDDTRCNVSDCAIAHCKFATGTEWKEAARRAVAAGEEPCQK